MILNPAPGDFVIGAAGAVTMLLIVGSFSYVLLFDFRCTIEPRTVRDKAKLDLAVGSFLCMNADSGFHPSAALRAAKYLLEANEHWGIIDQSTTDKRWKRRFIFLFQDYRCRWYPLMDVWISVLLGIVGGINLQKPTVCIAQISLIFAGYLLLLVGSLTRPALSRFTSVYLVCVNGCGFASATSTLLGTLLHDNRALSASSVSALLVSVFSMLKTIPDLALLVLAVPMLRRTVLKPFQDAHNHHELLRVDDDGSCSILILPATETDPVAMCNHTVSKVLLPRVESWILAKSIVANIVRNATGKRRPNGVVTFDDLFTKIFSEVEEGEEASDERPILEQFRLADECEQYENQLFRMLRSDKRQEPPDESNSLWFDFQFEN